METMDPVSDEYKATSDAALKLLDRATKMEELSIKTKEMDEARKYRKWDHILRGIGIALPPTIAL